MFRTLIGFVICLIGILLPHRLRVIFSEALGWFLQVFYLAFYGTLNFLITELKKDDSFKKNKDG